MPVQRVRSSSRKTRTAIELQESVDVDSNLKTVSKGDLNREVGLLQHVLNLILVFALIVFGYNAHQKMLIAESKLFDYRSGLSNPFQEDMSKLEAEASILRATLNDMLLTKEEQDALIAKLGADKSDMLSRLHDLRNHYDELETLYDHLKTKNTTCSHDDSSFDTRAKNASLKDDLTDHVFCWIDQIFGSQLFSTVQACRKVQETQTGCPFKSAGDAVRALSLHPQFILLQKSKEKSKERRKIIRDLSLLFHPDKMSQSGCPSEFGLEAIKEINSYSANRGGGSD
jgi:hypothetical protein